LHTIGFRGIGFKSTFSLGERVELDTPSLSIAFHRRRFTEPVWSGNPSPADGYTRVRVEISDPHRQREVEKNLEEWLKSPISLLFFSHIRRMQIGEKILSWDRSGAGPFSDSQWMTLNGEKNGALLVIRSQEEPFPDESLAEIRQERMLSAEEEKDFPPSKIEIVLGTEGRLFVVLPTGIKTALPFACNGPFIQDPARLKIKDAETSPTNRWLLERAGRLAASAMLAWLRQRDLPLEERARAYGLLPDVDREENSLEGVCGTIVEVALAAELGDETDVVLTDDGRLTREMQSVLIPEAVQDVWVGDQAGALLDAQSRPAVARSVSVPDRRKLVHWNMVEEINKEKFIEVLKTKHLPRPKTWRQLLSLWTYIAPEVTAHWTIFSPGDLRIVPVQGKDVLYAASEVVRLGEKKLLQSEEDWQFLGSYLIVLNPNWNRYLSEQRLAAEQQKDSAVLNLVNSAHAVLEKIGLGEISDVSTVIDRVAGEFFAKGKVELPDCIRLAQIAAALGATAGNSCRYVCRDMKFRSAEQGILFDFDGQLEELLPPAERDEKLLHAQYVAQFTSCTTEEWAKWVSSGRSGLLSFIPIIQKRTRIYGEKTIKDEARKRGVKSDLNLYYVTSSFILEDWDFEDGAWLHWSTSVANDPKVWASVARRIFEQPDAYWNGASSAKALQIATTGNTRSMTWEPMIPSWALRLREVPCLSDTRGFFHKPGDLLRRTAETEAYLDVEPFVHASLDREAKAPLLDLLGVRNKPTGPGQVLDRLRALSKAMNPPVLEVEKWYRRLDQMIDTCSTTDALAIKHAFRSEKLILADANAWFTSTGLYVFSGDDEVPGAVLVRASVRDLTLWRKIDVADRPTAELAIKWISELPSGQVLAQDDARRVRALLARYPARIWEECLHWTNLAGEWVPVGQLKYALTLQSLVPWRHLHESVRQKTADFQNLAAEISASPPFSHLPLLAAHIEERFQGNLFLSGHAEEKDWIQAVGEELCRIQLDDEDQTRRVRTLADELAATLWQSAPGLEIIPYIDGTPSGTPRRADVVWLKRVLYVDRLSKAKLAKRVPEEIGKAFNRQDIKAALDYSFERPPEDVRAYLAENFKLTPLTEFPTVKPAAPGQTPATDDPAKPQPVGAPAEEDPTDTTDVSPEIPVESPSAETEEQTHQRPRPQVKPLKPSIMERFASAHGFKKDGDGRFFHSNGEWIQKTVGMRIPWERRKASGDLVVYYWAEDHCLDQEPLQLEADVWHLMKNSPGIYALVLADIDGNAVEISGVHLQEMETSGRLKLYPASYRLVMDSKEHA